MKVRQTITFDPSPQVVAAVQSGNVGQARHGAKVLVDGKIQPDEVVIPPGATSFFVDVEIGSDIAIMLCAYDAFGTLSVASTFAFRAIDKIRPGRPTNIGLGKVSALSSQPASGHTVHHEDKGEPAFYNITVTDHPQIKPGAVGMVVGLDPVTKQSVHAIFDSSSLKPGVAPMPGGNEYDFSLDTPGAQVITPEQQTISLAEYAELVIKDLNEATDAVAA